MKNVLKAVSYMSELLCLFAVLGFLASVVLLISEGVVAAFKYGDFFKPILYMGIFTVLWGFSFLMAKFLEAKKSENTDV